MTRSTTSHAVVIGASIGGLMAARALGDHYDRVTVFDRDHLADDGSPRRGVPQGQHTHALLGRGREVLERRFPGFTDEVVAAGAPSGDAAARVRLCNDGHLAVQGHGGLLMLFASRPLVEATLRRRVAALPNVEVVPRTRVAALTTTDDRSRVTGVRLAADADDVADEPVLAAELVVDASGRRSPSPAWLGDLGYDAPEEEQVRIGIGYATRLYRRRPGDLDGDLIILVGPTGRVRRVGVMCANEDDRWTVSLGGYAGEHPPTEPAAWEAFAATLGRPDIAEAIAGLEPLDDPVPYRFPASLRRRYERLRLFPDGYLVTGDALCSFNPIFGQGMTAATLEAEELAACLERPGCDLARRFFTRAAAVIDVPWQVAVGADLRYPEVEGRRTVQIRVANAYTRHVSRAASVDATVATAFMRVVSMFDRPERLLRPAMAARVLRGSLRVRHSRAPSPAPATAIPTATPATP